jgi:hypothetical protein
MRGPSVVEAVPGRAERRRALVVHDLGEQVKVLPR